MDGSIDPPQKRDILLRFPKSETMSTMVKLELDPRCAKNVQHLEVIFGGAPLPPNCKLPISRIFPTAKIVAM